MKRIGPELKIPKLKGGELKAPPFLTDLYYDLRDRRLLPLVALILVAIVATPFLLSQGSDEAEPEAPVVPITGTTTPTAREKSLAVVEVDPGLRDYRKRLARRGPSDPFKQRFTGPMLEGTNLQQQGGSSASSTTTTTTTTTDGGGGGSESPPSSSPPSGPVETSPGDTGGGGGNGDPVPSSGLTFYTFAVNLQITRTETKKNGRKETEGPTVRKEVKPPSPLPGEKAPVVTYMGISAKTRKPLFLVSTDVQSMFGEGKCVAGTGTCQLVELDPGFPQTFVYGENQVRYKLNVLKVVPLITGRS